MVDDAILSALADAFDAASRSLRRSIAASEIGRHTAKDSSSALLARAMARHPQLGPRQAEVLELVAQAGEAGVGTGPLFRALGCDQAEVYQVLQRMVQFGFVAKDEQIRPHRYRIAPSLLA